MTGVSKQVSLIWSSYKIGLQSYFPSWIFQVGQFHSKRLSRPSVASFALLRLPICFLMLIYRVRYLLISVDYCLNFIWKWELVSGLVSTSFCNINKRMIQLDIHATFSRELSFSNYKPVFQRQQGRNPMCVNPNLNTCKFCKQMNNFLDEDYTYLQ